MKKSIIFVIFVMLLRVMPAVSKAQVFSVDSLVLLGEYYYHSERYIDAMDVLAKAMDQADQTGNDKAYVESLFVIGNIYTIFDDYEQALHYYIGCLDKVDVMKTDSLSNKIRSNMLICYSMLGKRKEAELCYRAIGTLNMGSEELNRFYTYLNQALLMTARNYPKGAIFFHRHAMDYAMAHGMNGLYVAAEMGQIGKMYEKMGDLDAAEEWYLKCKEYAEKGHYVGPLTTACERLALIYSKQGKDELSAKYNKLYVEYTDSFFRPKDFNNKKSLISRYEAMSKDRQVTRLRNKNTFLVLVIVVIAALMLALVALLVYIYKVNRRLLVTQRLLIKMHQEHSQQLEVQSEIFTNMENAAEQRVGGLSYAVADSDAASDGLDSTEKGKLSSEEDLLDKSQVDMLLMSIAQVMERTETVCVPDFSLTMLAQLVGSNTKYVSWVINTKYGKNFKTFLNEYRIRTASQMLVDTEKYGNLTIATIAERVGYKSPASFHLAFKKVYGMTPAVYIKLARQKED